MRRGRVCRVMRSRMRRLLLMLLLLLLLLDMRLLLV